MLTNSPAYSMRVFWSDDDGGYIAICPELHGISAFGPSEARAVEELKTAIALVIEDMRAAGEKLPDPARPASEYSGRFNLRLPKRLHRQLAEASEQDGVSLNSFCLHVLSDAVGQRSAARYCERRIAPLIGEMQICVDRVRTGFDRQRSVATTTTPPITVPGVADAPPWAISQSTWLPPRRTAKD